MRLTELYALAGKQGGVFARWQAIDLGMSHDAIARRVSAREWTVVVGSVLTPASTVLVGGSMEWAAYLACGRGSTLSGPSALRRHQPDVDLPEDEVRWVTIPPERHVRLASVRTIRENLDPSDVVESNGMRITTLDRSIVDTLRVLPPHRGQPVLDRALLRGWLTIANLESRTLAFAGRRGVGRLRTHLARVQDGARSEAERRLHVIIADIPGWIADFKIVDRDGEVLAVIDVAFPRQKIAIEVDGLAFHTDPGRFQQDRTRQNILIGLGWRVFRYTWDDLERRSKLIRRDITDALAAQDPTLRSDFRVSAEI